jgi:hypothetical protein
MRSHTTRPNAELVERGNRHLPRVLGAMLALLALALATGAAADERTPSHVPHEVLIELAPNVPERTVAAMARRLHLDRVASFASDGITVSRWRIRDRRSVPAVIRTLEAERIVLAAQPNYLYGFAAGGAGAR